MGFFLGFRSSISEKEEGKTNIRKIASLRLPFYSRYRFSRFPPKSKSETLLFSLAICRVVEENQLGQISLSKPTSRLCCHFPLGPVSSGFPMSFPRSLRPGIRQRRPPPSALTHSPNNFISTNFSLKEENIQKESRVQENPTLVSRSTRPTSNKNQLSSYEMGSEPAQESKTNTESFHKCNQASMALSISEVLGASTQGWSPGHSPTHEGTEKDQGLSQQIQVLSEHDLMAPHP